MTVKEAIKEIISKSKEDKFLLTDTKRFLGFLLDLAPEHKKEITVIKRSLDSDFLALCFKDGEDIKRRVFKMKYRLENQGLGENWIDFIIDSFFSPLGWEKPIDEEPSQLQTQQIQTHQDPNLTDWTCSCGAVNTANFCGNCGSAKPVPKSNDWTCSCGTVNTTNFCINCGKQKGEKQIQQQTKQQKQAQQSVQKQSTKQTQTQKKQQTQKQGNPLKNANVGDYIKFGNYPQTSDGGILPIEWQVLARESNKILIISRYGLDYKRFDSSANNWEKSEIRKWLNGYFYNKAFDENEKKFIEYSSISTTVYNKKVGKILGSLIRLFVVVPSEDIKNSFNKSSKSTNDRIFLLSKEEAERYFANNNERECKATDYAEKDDDCFFRFPSPWWLRSQYPDFSDYVYLVSRNGSIGFDFVYGGYISSYSDNRELFLVRPAMWINI